MELRAPSPVLEPCNVQVAGAPEGELAQRMCRLYRLVLSAPRCNACSVPVPPRRQNVNLHRGEGIECLPYVPCAKIHGPVPDKHLESGDPARAHVLWQVCKLWQLCKLCRLLRLCTPAPGRGVCAAALMRPSHRAPWPRAAAPHLPEDRCHCGC